MRLNYHIDIENCFFYKYKNEKNLRELIYLQDNHGYTAPYPVLFCTDCDWSIEKLEKLSWKCRGAGRLATSFEEFKSLLEKEGFEVIPICLGEPGQELKLGIEKIKGATGNY